MIGARTLAVLGVAALALTLGWTEGVLDLEYLRELEAAACLLVGLFASLATVVAVSIWHLDGRSVFGIGIHRGKLVAAAPQRLGRVARDVPIGIQRALYFLAFAAIGLLSFGPGSAAQLANAGTILGAGGSEYCPDPDDVEPVARAAAPVVDQRGCALVRRAFELGYRKNLGNCEPRKAEAPVATAATTASRPCALRQRGEPALHYAWRLLEGRVGVAIDGASGTSIARATGELRIKLDYLPALTATTQEAILGSPRAAHHLWTNLPAPRHRGLFERALGKNRCAARFGAEQPRLDWSGEARPESALVEAAIGQLLFSPRHGAVAGNCEELTIHWDAPTDTCARLATEPIDVLESDGALDGVHAVLGRHRSRNRRAELASELGRGKVSLRAPDIRRVISFQCFFVAAGSPMPIATATEETIATVDGAALLVRERRVSELVAVGAGQLDVYRHLAALLAGGRYTGPVTETGVESRRDAPLPTNVLETSDFPLARLEFLYDADPFLGERWPLERDDLTEVYPFEVHLRHFTEVFRRRYLNVRGRL